MEISYSPAVAAVLVNGLAPLSALHEAADLERAMVRVAALTPPGAMPDVLAEVNRRREFLRGERAAYESVGDDLAAGRWMP